MRLDKSLLHDVVRIYPYLVELSLLGKNYYLMNQILLLTVVIFSQCESSTITQEILNNNHLLQKGVTICLEGRSEIEVIFTLNQLLTIATKGEYYYQIERQLFLTENLIDYIQKVEVAEKTKYFEEHLMKGTQFL